MLDLFNKHLLRTHRALREKAQVGAGGAGARGEAANQAVSGWGALCPAPASVFLVSSVCSLDSAYA